jgi:hypothetical protein
VSANTKTETLSDMFRVARNLEVRCQCGHRSVVDGENFARWMFIKRYDTRVHMLRGRFRCSSCGSRPIAIRPASNAPTAPNRWPKDEGAWKRMIARMRG